ncbi:hypothetical protein AB0J82_27230 [Asanoa sp. NPDC049518]|uniref:hypothetical protein n=1 Tax=unclassified Asanoa TaxID=2685164 RepID=UPI0034129B57
MHPLIPLPAKSSVTSRERGPKMISAQAGMAVIDVDGVFIGTVAKIVGAAAPQGLVVTAWRGDRTGWRWIPLGAAHRVQDEAVRLSIQDQMLSPFTESGHALAPPDPSAVEGEDAVVGDVHDVRVRA